ncbi:uncharacterized protein [Argopecten irradians]|uniref:uncharacterized protein n=1 Tax=Argopecten irradians TaxID=31199 RepID=UPI0037240B04
MVNKNSKRSVHSGNTLRASNTRDSKLYRRQSYLIRQSKKDSTITPLDELGLDRDHVAYSLNKKGRWLVPQILKHEVILGEEDVKVDIVESHKLKRKNKCTGFYSNDGFPRKVLPKKTYFNASSVNSQTVDPKVTVDIVTPCPRTSSLAHNPKYLDYSPTPVGRNDTDAATHEESNPPNSRKNVRRKKTFMNNTIDDYLDIDFSEDEDDDPSYEDMNRRPNDIYLGDVLVHSNDMQELLFRELAGSGPSDAFGITESQSSFVNEVRFEEEETSHTTVLIPNTEVVADHLKEAFGEDYTECRCLPRKFLIDITDRVTRTISKSKAFQNRDNRRIDLSAILVFTYNMIGSLDLTDIDSFKVSINMKTTQRCLKMDAFPENSVMGVEGIVQCAVSYIASLSHDSFISRNSAKTQANPTNNNRNILKLCTTEATVFAPANITIKDKLTENRSKRYESDGAMNLSFPDTCPICFDSVQEGAATALQTCGHWFCDRCWNDHVTSSGSVRSGQITCPQYKCQCPVDYGILLTIANLQIVEGLFRRHINMDIEKDPNSQWCPNKTCGRVVTYDRAGLSTNVSCECGTVFCFRCLQPVHWPLSCRDYEKYREKLVKYGHVDKALKSEEVFTFNVQGKRCPVCNIFMEKNGGCFTITCICGALFCWGCRIEIRNHPPQPCYKGDMYSVSGDRYNTRKRRIIATIHGPDYDKPTWYKRAVEVRALRNPSKVKLLVSSVRSMCKTALRLYKHRPDTDIAADLENFEVPELHSPVSLQDKIHSFLTSMVTLYVELSPVCEYISVILEKCHDQSLVQLRDRLQSLIEEMFSIFIAAHSSHILDLKSSISRLFQLRLECNKVFEMVVTALE